MVDKRKHPLDYVGDDPIDALRELVAVVETDDSYCNPVEDSEAYAVLLVAKEATRKLAKRGVTATLAKLLLSQPDFNVPQRIRDVLQTYAYKD